MMPEELAHTNTSAQIRLGVDAHTHIETWGWADTRQEVGMTLHEVACAGPLTLDSFSRETVRIELDGRVVLGEGIQPDEAAKQFWTALEGAAQLIRNAAIAEEREACIRDIWAGDLSHPAAIEARIRARARAEAATQISLPDGSLPADSPLPPMGDAGQCRVSRGTA